MLFKSVLTSALLALSLGAEVEASGRLSKLARSSMERAEKLVENARCQKANSGNGQGDRFLNANTKGEYFDCPVG